MAFIYENGKAFAYQLSHIMNTNSRQVYPILKTWIEKGIVVITKMNRVNVYSISHKFRTLINDTVRRYSHKERDFIIAKAS